MTYSVIQLNDLFLAGVNYYGDALGNTDTSPDAISQTWQRFIAYVNSNPRRRYPVVNGAFYEIHLSLEQATAPLLHPGTNQSEIFIGELVETSGSDLLFKSLLSTLPPRVVLKRIPRGTFLKLELKGEEILSDYRKRAKDIAYTLGYGTDPHMVILAYDHRFKGMDHILDSELDVLVPLVLTPTSQIM